MWLGPWETGFYCRAGNSVTEHLCLLQVLSGCWMLQKIVVNPHKILILFKTMC